MKVSIVTVTYNRAEQLRRGLNTILSQSVLPNELVIVDDGSSDNTKIAVADLEYTFGDKVEFKYIYLDHPEPRISCIPRNVGIKAATGDVIIFTEPEGLHVGDTIKQLLEKMEQNPESVILASQVWSMGRRIWEKLDNDYYKYPARIISHEYAMLTEGNMQNTNAPDSDFAITGELNCNAGVLFAVKKQWLMDIGGFDEDFFGHAWDDFDLFHRLGMYGKPLLKCPDIAVIHQWHEKNYPYNIYEAAEANGAKSAQRAAQGEYRANIGKDWGQP